MKANKRFNEIEESTYSLLVRSEEMKRDLFETLVYGLIIVSAVVAILQFSVQPDSLPFSSLKGVTLFYGSEVPR